VWDYAAQSNLSSEFGESQLAYSYNLKAKELKKAKNLITEYRGTFEEKWNEYFTKK